MYAIMLLTVINSKTLTRPGNSEAEARYYEAKAEAEAKDVT